MEAVLNCEHDKQLPSRQDQRGQQQFLKGTIPFILKYIRDTGEMIDFQEFALAQNARSVGRAVASQHIHGKSNATHLPTLRFLLERIVYICRVDPPMAEPCAKLWFRPA